MAKKKKSTAKEPSVVETAKALAGAPTEADPFADQPWVDSGVEFDYSMRVRIRLIEDLLGTVPLNPDVYEAHIISKIRKELAKPSIPDNVRKELEQRLEIGGAEEKETVPESEEKGHTGFHRDDQGLFLYDYLLRGFLKAAAGALKDKENRGKKNKVIPWAHKQLIDELVFVSPRRIHLGKTEPDGLLERPLRAETAQGPRVALARSDYVSAGTEFDLTINVVDGVKVPKKLLNLLMRYGKEKGLGQFRNGSYGRFIFKMVEME
jgi:hypothetical protein